jgi:hypothetical protein
MPAAMDRGKTWWCQDDGGETDRAETAVPRSLSAREIAGREEAVAATETAREIGRPLVG